MPVLGQSSGSLETWGRGRGQGEPQGGSSQHSQEAGRAPYQTEPCQKAGL